MTRFKGFTLVELMVILALVAIIAAIAVPNFNNLVKNNRLEAQAEELNALLQYARSEAVIRKVTTTVTLDDDTGEVDVAAGGSTLRSTTLSLGNITLSASQTSVSYTPNGTASPADFAAVFCSDSTPASGRLLTVAASGSSTLHHKGKKADGSALGSCSL